MRAHNKGDHRVKLIDYASFVASLRLPLEGRRAEIVKDAFCTINSEEGATCFTIAQAKAAFKYEEFARWCDAIEVANTDDQVVTLE